MIPVGSVRKWHQLTGQRQRKICVREVWAEISIVVISTDPSETIHIRGGQVVLEGRNQLFINSALNSSCGQLRGKQFYVKKCINSLAMFPIWAWIQTNSIEAWFIIVMKITSVRFENLSRRISVTTVQKPRTKLLCTVTLNTCGSSLRNIFPVNFPV